MDCLEMLRHWKDRPSVRWVLSHPGLGRNGVFPPSNFVEWPKLGYMISWAPIISSCTHYITPAPRSALISSILITIKLGRPINVR